MQQRSCFIRGSRALRILDEVKLDFDDVLLTPKRSLSISRKDIVLERTFDLMHCGRKIEVMPLFVSNMSATGTVGMANSLYTSGVFICLHKFYNNEDLRKVNFPVSDNCFYSMGIKDEDLDKLKKMIELDRDQILVDGICIDAANGYTDYFEKRLRQVRKLLPNSIIMAGNVCTPEMTQQLLLAGADIIKIGIGPGSACATRRVTGVGYPQLSAIMECADVAHGIGGLVCADGGCKQPGDVVKAFAAGADFVMLGGMLAGTDECEGEWAWGEPIREYKPHDIYGNMTIPATNVRVKRAFKFCGMSSTEKMIEHYGSANLDYRASEGDCHWIDAKGPAINVINEILGGLRSACAYVGARRLKDLSKCATFLRVNRIK